MTSSFFEGGPGRRTILQQALLPWYTNAVFTHKYSEEYPETVARLLRGLSHQAFGFAIQLSIELGDVKVHGIAFATGDNVYHIKCNKYSVDLDGHDFAALLDSRYGLLVGFEMASQMLHVYRELDLDSIGVDISALRPARLTRSRMPSDYVSLYLGRNVDNLQIDGLFYGSSLNSDENSCLRAWLAAKVAETEWRRIQLLPRLDTRMLPKKHIDCISSLARNIEVRKYIQPTFLENEFDSIELTEGRLVVRNARFKTRIRASAKTSVHMNSGTGSTIAVGRAIHAIGKDTYIKLSNGSYNEKVQKIQVRGREEPSPFVVAQAKFIMSLLCKEITLTDRPFIDMLWLSSEPPRSYGSAPIQYALEHPTFDSLNESQCRVAAAMISDSLVITHGPPGTGKTATIAASVKYWQTRGAPVWVIAKSNVAVKNIARSLLNIDVQQFKMIVSREFFTGWHEEIYDRLRRQVVHIDNLDEAVPEIERTLGGCRVILCTMGTLSSPILDHGLFNLVPVVRLIIDESSQIDVSDFMHLLHKFDRLTKLCFFGDPKQRRNNCSSAVS
ncbi:hypothetical protein C8Q75DRAFT_489128 [Abortiporus biennis]|nr:hypothetical protein C8Q75DRAFT_489128 [Abortiporus biennis]